MIYQDFIPERLAQLRIQKGISARDMSLSMGQADNYINNIENRKTLPSMKAFFYICEYLEIAPQEFFNIENHSPKRLRELISEGKKLDDKALTHIVGIMKEINQSK